ncbi:hypothetical protein [Mesonia aquimarina]|uniref:hypothetical protein n=1 Tax=Mesonia aquimarina TaxID=1504967 RepID=UPI000EF63248|nr:hypothetical protein [Mesonia aquimarina]
MGEFYRCFFYRRQQTERRTLSFAYYSVLVGLVFWYGLGVQVYAQSITNLSLNAAYACATSNFNSYQASYQVQGVFANDNSFVLELSDAQGGLATKSRTLFSETYATFLN